MKKLLIALAAAVALAAAWYLVSPLWRVIEADDASPVPSTDVSVPPDPMDMPDAPAPEDQAAFDEEMERVGEEGVEMEDPMLADAPRIVAQGSFMEHAHEVEGAALLIEHEGGTTLRFEDFETVNGPNLHIWLAADEEGKDYIDLGPIKATKGNVNYEVDPSIDFEKYDKVLVWCVPFKVLFSSARLQ